MNVLFIHHVADMYGSSQSVLRLTRAFVQGGDDVSVVLKEDGPLRDALESAGASVRIVPELPVLHRNRLKNRSGRLELVRSAIKAPRIIGRMIREVNPDIIHSNTSTILPLVGHAARKNGIPFIQHYRESFREFGFLWPIYRAWLLKNATRVISISNYLATQFTDKQRKKYVRVARNGIPLKEFTPPPKKDVYAFKEKWNLRGPVITLVGRIKLKRKGQEVFLQAAAILTKQYPDAQFLVAGSPFPGNEAHLEILQQMSKDLRIESQVLFVGNIKDIRVVLANSTISVMASATPEPLGNVTMESMAMGVPVIGTSIGGTPELIKDGRTGLLVPPSDPKVMADAMAKLLGQPELAENMAREGKKHFVEELSFKPFYSRIRSIYAEALGEKTSPPTGTPPRVQ